MSPLYRNLRLTCRTVIENLADDPFHFILQTSRRLPARLVIPAARRFLGGTPKGSIAVPVLVAELLSGNQTGLQRRLELALQRKPLPRSAVKLADIALSAQQPGYADRLLAGSSGRKGHPAVLARRRWYSGSVSDAIAALAGEEEPAGGRKGQRQRLESEAELLRGWTPKLRSAPMVPVPDRVLHLLTNSLPHTRSGYAQRSHSILLAQKEAGWEPLAVTRVGYPVMVGKIAARGEDVVDGVTYRRLLPAKLAPTPTGRLQQQAEELLQLALEFRPSVIHTTTHYVNGLVARAVANALGIPWVYEVRGQLADTWASTRGPEAIKSERYTLFQEREADLMQSADLVVTLGEAMKKNIMAARVPEEKIIIAPNAVGGEYLREPLDLADARIQLGLDPDDQIIGTVSSLVPYEGLDDLIDAFTLLAPVFPRLKLLIVGSGVSLPSLKEQARRSGLASRITFTGLVTPNLARAYHQALDVFVVPRKDLDVTRSVTPLKPVEAMASGRPVVASDLPALAEIVHNGHTGLLAPADDPAALADVVAPLLQNAVLRDALGDAGRQRVLATRTWAANAAATVRSYQAIAEDQSRRAR
ncbi:Glycosyltransferase involved in cell wall bisynthesis [Pseudarthrobacter enclensis]|uniref:D-inositol 3-phosphate glycosyltransferase n=1 Tax=Pseudarthrobacter enclensis TaxID=993070 RepID=A0A0V8IV81_9MICC|nr:glycosyltransferase family 4 protein [Pseudarthrobacter enclensis]KSU78673.1 glycosyltransferase WbuB [Pseudarthrobacter enclensis]SCB75006.1 Glycosyltransferase involved in cell wall bisynthesis [Pseudarthrobacter enclensis]